MANGEILSGGKYGHCNGSCHCYSCCPVSGVGSKISVSLAVASAGGTEKTELIAELNQLKELPDAKNP